MPVMRSTSLMLFIYRSFLLVVSVFLLIKPMPLGLPLRQSTTLKKASGTTILLGPGK